MSKRVKIIIHPRDLQTYSAKEILQRMQATQQPQQLHAATRFAHLMKTLLSSMDSSGGANPQQPRA